MIGEAGEYSLSVKVPYGTCYTAGRRNEGVDVGTGRLTTGGLLRQSKAGF